jgi:hypothetical protein
MQPLQILLSRCPPLKFLVEKYTYDCASSMNLAVSCGILVAVIVLCFMRSHPRQVSMSAVQDDTALPAVNIEDERSPASQVDMTSLPIAGVLLAQFGIGFLNAMRQDGSRNIFRGYIFEVKRPAWALIAERIAATGGVSGLDSVIR